MKKLAVLVKKQHYRKPLLRSLMKNFVDKTVQRQFLGIFLDVKAFVLEHTYNPSNNYQINGVHCGTERIEKNGDCSARAGAKLLRDS
jgi:hypothetical protein